MWRENLGKWGRCHAVYQELPYLGAGRTTTLQTFSHLSKETSGKCDNEQIISCSFLKPPRFSNIPYFSSLQSASLASQSIKIFLFVWAASIRLRSRGVLENQGYYKGVFGSQRGSSQLCKLPLLLLSHCSDWWPRAAPWVGSASCQTVSLTSIHPPHAAYLLLLAFYYC